MQFAIFRCCFLNPIWQITQIGIICRELQFPIISDQGWEKQISAVVTSTKFKMGSIWSVPEIFTFLGGIISCNTHLLLYFPPHDTVKVLCFFGSLTLWILSAANGSLSQHQAASHSNPSQAKVSQVAETYCGIMPFISSSYDGSSRRSSGSSDFGLRGLDRFSSSRKSSVYESPRTYTPR